jgi:hypothetical protein
LQTFPVDVRVAGEYRSALRQIGNAVPSAIGEMLGLEIRRQFFGARVRRKLRLIPAKRADKPRAYARKPVPTEYKRLALNPADHPGKGKGPGSIRRWEAALGDSSLLRENLSRSNGTLSISIPEVPSVDGGDAWKQET